MRTAITATTGTLALAAGIGLSACGGGSSTSTAPGPPAGGSTEYTRARSQPIGSALIAGDVRLRGFPEHQPEQHRSLSRSPGQHPARARHHGDCAATAACKYG